jgi:hypothetical protein
MECETRKIATTPGPGILGGFNFYPQPKKIEKTGEKIEGRGQN